MRGKAPACGYSVVDPDHPFWDCLHFKEKMQRLYMAAMVLLSAKDSDEVRVAALYALYAMYFSVPSELRVPIRATPRGWRNLLDLCAMAKEDALGAGQGGSARASSREAETYEQQERPPLAARSEPCGQGPDDPWQGSAGGGSGGSGRNAMHLAHGVRAAFSEMHAASAFSLSAAPFAYSNAGVPVGKSSGSSNSRRPRQCGQDSSVQSVRALLSACAGGEDADRVKHELQLDAIDSCMQVYLAAKQHLSAISQSANLCGTVPETGESGRAGEGSEEQGSTVQVDDLVGNRMMGMVPEYVSPHLASDLCKLLDTPTTQTSLAHPSEGQRPKVRRPRSSTESTSPMDHGTPHVPGTSSLRNPSDHGRSLESSDVLDLIRLLAAEFCPSSAVEQASPTRAYPSPSAAAGQPIPSAVVQASSSAAGGGRAAKPSRKDLGSTSSPSASRRRGAGRGRIGTRGGTGRAALLTQSLDGAEQADMGPQGQEEDIRTPGAVKARGVGHLDTAVAPESSSESDSLAGALESALDDELDDFFDVDQENPPCPFGGSGGAAAWRCGRGGSAPLATRVSPGPVSHTSSHTGSQVGCPSATRATQGRATKASAAKKNSRAAPQSPGDTDAREPGSDDRGTSAGQVEAAGWRGGTQQRRGAPTRSHLSTQETLFETGIDQGLLNELGKGAGTGAAAGGGGGGHAASGGGGGHARRVLAMLARMKQVRLFSFQQVGHTGWMLPERHPGQLKHTVGEGGEMERNVNRLRRGKKRE